MDIRRLYIGFGAWASALFLLILGLLLPRDLGDGTARQVLFGLAGVLLLTAFITLSLTFKAWLDNKPPGV